MASDNLRGSLWMMASMAGFAAEDGFLKRAASEMPLGQVLLFEGLLGILWFSATALRAGSAPLPRAALSRTGAVAGQLERLAEELSKSPEDFLATLVAAGLKVPDKSREKPVFVPHAGEIFWLNRNAKDELWLNAKASKFAEGEVDEGDDAEKKSANRRGGRSRRKGE
jgi:hypothetical protein